MNLTEPQSNALLKIAEGADQNSIPASVLHELLELKLVYYRRSPVEFDLTPSGAHVYLQLTEPGLCRSTRK